MEYTRIGKTDFPTEDSKGRSLEQLKQRYGSHVSEKVIQLLYDTLHPKQKQPKKKPRAEEKPKPEAETKVENSKDN